MTTVVAAIIRKDGKILITRRFDHAHLPGMWEFPGGKVELGESLQAALKREIVEELGVEIAVFDEYFFAEHEYPEKSVRIHFFECAVESGEPRAIEVADLRWVTPSELSEYAFPDADRELLIRLQLSSG